MLVAHGDEVDVGALGLEALVVAKGATDSNDVQVFNVIRDDHNVGHTDINKVNYAVEDARAHGNIQLDCLDGRHREHHGVIFDFGAVETRKCFERDVARSNAEVMGEECGRARTVTTDSGLGAIGIIIAHFEMVVF